MKHRTPAKSLFRPATDRTPPLPATDSPGEPALDLDALMALPGVNGDRAAPMLKRLLPLFVAETERHIQGLRAGLAAGNAEAVRALAHKMKSGCHAVGALRLAACARRLDERIKAGEPPRTADVEGIADAWEACRQVLHKEALIGEDAPK